MRFVLAVLLYEPNNPEANSFLPLIQEKQALGECELITKYGQVSIILIQNHRHRFP